MRRVFNRVGDEMATTVTISTSMTTTEIAKVLTRRLRRGYAVKFDSMVEMMTLVKNDVTDFGVRGLRNIEPDEWIMEQLRDLVAKEQLG